MNRSSTPFQTEAERRADKLAALLEMGFECVEGPVTTEVTPVAGQWRVSQSVAAMGTVASLTVLHDSRQLAEQAIGRALEEMTRLVALLNRYESSSAVGVLNRDGRLAGAPPELIELLARASGMHRLSSGAFDVTVQPVIDLYRQRHADGYCTLPARSQVAAAAARVDARQVSVHGRDVHFENEGVGVTLDGIAKGFIVDRMAAALEAHGAADFLVNAGGDIRVRGSKEGGVPWTVAVQDPDGREPLPDRLRLRGGAVATSGSYEIYFDEERTWHHLVRSDSGLSPLESSSVTVLAPSALQADALATAVFVMGPVAGTRLIESLPGCECLIVSRERQLVRSTGWEIPAEREEMQRR